MEQIVIGYLDLKKIIDDGYLPVDMHVHSRISDSHTRIKSILKRAQRLGIGVSITDHNNIRGAMIAHDLNKDFFIIPGIELAVRERAHILVYFYSFKDLHHFYHTHIRPRRSRIPYLLTKVTMEEAIGVLEEYNCLTSAAHPFSGTRMGLMKNVRKGKIDLDYVKLIDAIEVVSGHQNQEKNEQAADFAVKNNKAYTAGSDAHTRWEIGRTISYSKASTTDEFLDLVRKKKNFVAGKNTNLLLKRMGQALGIDKYLRGLIIKP